MPPLRARQERFCRRFVEYGCATTAAVAAGHSPRSAKNAGYRRAIVDHQFHAAARAVHLQAKLRRESGQARAEAPAPARNDDFCTGEKACRINTLRGIDDDFCSPAEKPLSWNINGLTRRNDDF